MKQNNIGIQIEVFVLFITTLSGFLIYFSRLGLDNDIYIILKSISLSYLIILFPSFFIKYFLKKEVKIFFTKPVISFLIILLLIFSGYLKIITGIDLSYIYFVFGFYLFFSYFFSNLFNLKIKKQTLMFLIISICFSFFITAAYYNNHYVHPLMIEKIINGASAHRDILYHSSIAGMFKTYFFGGTGVDGFVPHYYHSLSHYTFGILCELLNINTLTFYSIIFPIIVTPIFIMFFIYASFELSKYFSEINYFKPSQEKNILVWILIYIFFSLPMNQYVLPERYHYISSQSYSFALILLFLIIYLVFACINIQNLKINLKYKRISSYFVTVVIILLSICASYSKVSFAYVLTIFSLFIFIRFQFYKNIFYSLSFLIWAIFIIFFYFDVIIYFNGRDLTNIKSDLEDVSYINEFLFSYFSISFIILKLISLKIYSFNKLIYNFKKKKILDIEILFILILALHIVHYNYFKGIQLYISYILIIAHLNLLYNFLFKKKDINTNV